MSPHESAQPADQGGPHEVPAAGEQTDNKKVNEQVGGVNAFSLSHKRIGSTAEAEVVVHLKDGTTFTRTFNVMLLAARGEFVIDVAKKFPGILPADILLQLVPISAEVGEQLLVEQDEKAAAEENSSQKSLLVALATDKERVELFHTAGRHEAELFARILIDEHWETWSIFSKAFRWWLVGVFEEETGETPGSQALIEALNVIIARAMFRSPEHPVFVRIAEFAGAIWIDLGNPNYEAIRITNDRWEVLPGCRVPVRFIRRRGMLALATPVSGGSVHELRSLVNVPDDRSWILLVAALVSFLWPNGPYVILVVNGEQGCAKSTLCRFIRALIDPNKAALRRPPRDDRDLMIAATNGWIVALDNLSGVAANLSDAICSLATGGGFATRELYSDADEKLFEAMRPVLLNGIPDLATRPDLLDRAIVFVLPTIPEEKRRDEAELRRAFEDACPRILGSILDGVSMALRRRGNVKFDRLPRMADFALIAAAAMPAFGWTDKQFLDAYLGNRAEAHDVAIEASAIGPAVLALATEKGTWEGTASQLLDELERCSSEKTLGRKDWPRSARALREAISRLAPNLRASGVNVTFGKRKAGGKRDRLIVIEKSEPAPPEPPSPDGDDPGGRDDPPPPRDEAHGDDRPGESGPDGAVEADRDDRDDGDGENPTLRAEPGSSSNGADASSPTPSCSKVGFQPSQPSPPSRSGPAVSGTAISTGRSRDDRGDELREDRPGGRDGRDDGDGRPPIVDQVLSAFDGTILDGNPPPPPLGGPKPSLASGELFRDEDSSSWGTHDA